MEYTISEIYAMMVPYLTKECFAIIWVLCLLVCIIIFKKIVFGGGAYGAVHHKQ